MSRLHYQAEIEYRNPDQLHPSPDNDKIHTEEQVERLALVIKEHGFDQPIVADEEGEIIKGVGRWMAAKKIGLPMVPVITRTDMSKAERIAARLADNHVSSLEYDNTKTIKGLKSLQELGMDLKLSGIKGKQLAKVESHIRSLTRNPEEDEGEDEIPEATEAITKPGDLWVLGEHRLLCGDCTDPANIEKLMDGALIDVTFTDPPYNVNYDYNFHNDNKSDEDYLEWTKEWVTRVTQSSNKDAWFWIKNAPRNLPGFFPIAKECEWTLKNIIVWPHPSALFPSNRFQDSWDSLAVYGRGKPAFHTKAQTVECGIPLSQGGGTHMDGRIGDVWAGVKYISAGAMASKEAILKPGTKSKAHPCQMPIELPSRALKFCSNKGSRVMDPFSGSGSTLIACQKTDRACYGMEIDPHYCDIIVKRWEEYTKKKAQRHSDPITRKAEK